MMAGRPSNRMRRPRRSWLSALVVGALAALLMLAGCATVQPWERGRLSHRTMREGAEPEADNMASHEAGAREGALTPGASGGGGCGCN
ncbi:MAG: DUF4266 domain-containing protein [Deltaproteobacteria bacterium]|nr:DUF4266 domain-containing protein [Deltaproteobacteria bacterium]